MRQLEKFYKENTNIKELIRKEEPTVFIEKLSSYFQKASVIPKKRNEKTMKHRVRYVSKRTSEILIEIIHLWGNDYPSEVIKLLSEQDFTIRYDVCEKLNVFQYLAEHMNTLQFLNDTKVWSLFHFALRNNDEMTFGKEIFVSGGNQGDGYGGFINDLYSTYSIEDGEYTLNFRYEACLKSYDIVNLGNNFGVSLSTLGKFKGYKRREDRESALDLYTQELNRYISSRYTGTHTRFTVGLVREHLPTIYNIEILKTVKLQGNYEMIKQTIVDTIKMFNNMENQVFGYENMEPSRAELIQSFEIEPLFS